MISTFDTPPTDLERIPGLFRRWELTEIFEPGRDFHIEDAGAHADGTPLLAVFVSDPIRHPLSTISVLSDFAPNRLKAAA